MNTKIFFEAQNKILEELFGRKWFSEKSRKKTNHPAYLKWKLCAKLISQNGIIKWPEDTHNFSEVADIILNNYFLLQCSGGNINKLELGSFANFGDDPVRKRLISVLQSETHFSSLMTELSYAAWHISKGHKVIAYEDEGYPDFQVIMNSTKLPLVTDCKRIFKDTNNSRLSKVITKANKQIKKIAIDCYGICVIDITEKITNNNHFSDNIPQEVLDISSVVSKSIQTKNSSVSAVLLLWNDYVLHGIPETSPTSLFAYRRRGYLVSHSDPKYNLPKNIELFAFGNTITYRVTWKQRN